jgi:tetratricopeptide (TPR) repeat protein
LQAAIDDSSTKIVSVAASILVQLLNDLSISSHSHALSTLITNTLPLLEHFSSHVTCPFDKLWAVVEGIYDHIPSFTVIIDALDECFATEDASSLVSKLMHMSSLPQARVIILSRHHTSLLTPLSECAQIEMDESMIANDITLFIDREVNRTPQIRVPVNEIIERATTGARGMFLWAKLMLEYVKHGSTLNNQRTRLQKFPVELTNVYDQMLSEAGAKLESEQLLDRRRIFMLLVAATSPLSVVEITVALALDTVDMHPHKDDLLIDPMERIGKLCWPFTKTIEGRVQFVHYSMQEYLVTEDCRTVSASSRDPATFLRFSSQECNDYIALKCMFRLINAEARSINTIEPLLRKRIEDHDLAVSSNGLPSDWPLYSYATRNWYIHVVKSANSFALLQHVSIFLTGLEFITWVEEYHTENCDMGAVVEVQATLSSWHAGLSEKQRQEVHICQFMERPFKDFCALESVFRKTPEITYMAMHRLGLYENTSGTGTNTLKLCAAVAEGFSTTLGHLHPLTLRCITRWCIERIIAPVRELPAGEALLIETMSLQLQILGASHPDSYYTQQIAGLAMYYRAHFHSALYHLRHSCDGLLRTLGPNHEYYQHSRLYYAHVLTGLGRFEEAACIYREIWRHWARLHGSQHPLCSMAQCNLGLMYRKLGRFLPAEEHLMEALAQRQRMFHKHEVIIDSYIQIALLRRDQQDIDAATAYLDLAEAELDGMGFERYAQVQHLRALLLLDSGDRVDACRVLAALLAKGAAYPSNRNILWARLSLADLLRDCGHQGKALSLFMNLVEGIGEGKKKGNSGDVKAYLQVAEKALRMARHQGSEAADAELDRHNLRWRSPEAIWIIFGGPAAEVYSR